MNIYKVIFDDECELYVEKIALDYIPFTKPLIDDLIKNNKLEFRIKNINSNIFSVISVLVKMKLNDSTDNIDYKKNVIDIIITFNVDKLLDFISTTNRLGLIELRDISSEYFKSILVNNTVDKIKEMYSL
jgi:hypothetical protein